MGRGNTGPVYPWFGQDIRHGVALAVENYDLLRRLWRADVVDWQGRCRTPLQSFTSIPRPLDGIPPSSGTARSATPRSRSRLLLWRRLLPQPHLLEHRAHRPDGRALSPAVQHYGHGQADQALVGLGGQVFMRPRSQDAVAEFRPYFDVARVYGHGPSLEEFSRETPLTVGSPQQVIERTLSFADAVGDYQPQLFQIDHAGLPLSTVLEQMEILGTQVVPVLRRELEARRPAHVPSDPPTHATLLQAGDGHPNAHVDPRSRSSEATR